MRRKTAGKEGPAIAAGLLDRLGFDSEVSERVQYLIGHHHTYNNIDGIDYQILVEADFLVNICDDNLTKDAALKHIITFLRRKAAKDMPGNVWTGEVKLMSDNKMLIIRKKALLSADILLRRSRKRRKQKMR